MYDLRTVKVAINSGDRRKALVLLQKILKEHPSAEAHYLAAKLAPNRMMAKKQLAHALHYNPQYEEAFTMLAVIQREELLEASTGNLRDNLLDEMEPEDNSNYLKRFNRWIGAQAS